MLVLFFSIHLLPHFISLLIFLCLSCCVQLVDYHCSCGQQAGLVSSDPSVHDEILIHRATVSVHMHTLTYSFINATTFTPMACPVSINSVILPLPYIKFICVHKLGYVCVYIYSTTHRLPGADLRLGLNVADFPWFTHVYDQDQLVICLVKPSVRCVCQSLVSASWPPSL